MLLLYSTTIYLFICLHFSTQAPSLVNGRNSSAKLQLLPNCPPKASSRPVFAALPANHSHLAVLKLEAICEDDDLCEHTNLHCYSCQLFSHIFPLVTRFLVLGIWSAKSLGWELPKIMNKKCKIDVELCSKYVEK